LKYFEGRTPTGARVILPVDSQTVTITLARALA
jgi:hypothetical protein